MKKNIFFLALVSLTFIQCSKEKDPFLITKNNVGLISNETQLKQLDSIFTADSLVRVSPQNSFMSGSSQGQVEVYEKGGKLLMTLSPKANDSDSKIGHIQIFDERYKTDKGLHLKSTFKDVKSNYTIASIQSTLRNVVVSLKESNVYITIDKNELPESLRHNPELTIESTQIPDNAKLKYLMIDWERD